MIDAHHHLWDLSAVHYPWLMAKGVTRFFGDPSPIQRTYNVEEFRKEANAQGVRASVHIQVGAESAMAEARWIQSVADANPDWPIAQVVFCDLTAPDLTTRLSALSALPSVRGVRQIVGRAPGEDAQTGTNTLLDEPHFLAGLKEVQRQGLSFDLQLIPELMKKTANVLKQVPDLQVALCHAGSPHDRSASGVSEWANSLRDLSALQNVTCKLPGLGMFDHSWTTERFAPIVETVLSQFGPHRVMFGSNFPVDKLYSSYATLFTAFQDLVPNGAKQAVFHDTAARFYRLNPQAL